MQVRQKVIHQRTMLHLEQLILKHNAHRDVLNIKQESGGMDFFFSELNKANAFVDFLSSVVPMKCKKSQELISQDIHTATKSYKFTFSCELVPICRDDLVALPIKIAKQHGNIFPLTFCHKVSSLICPPYFIRANGIFRSEHQSTSSTPPPFSLQISLRRSTGGHRSFLLQT